MNTPTKKTSPTLSVILPSYKSYDVAKVHVPILIDYLGSLDVSNEIIIVDDGSDDEGKTRGVARDLKCQYLENPKNMGKGAAVRRGMKAATGKFRVYTDIDVPYDLDVFDKILFYLDVKEFHFVAGDRTLKESSYYKRVGTLRVLSSHVYSTIVGRFVAGGWFDTQCGIKGFRDHVAEDLFSVSRVNRFAFDVELFYIALKRNYDIKRISVSLRSNDTSSVNVIRDGSVMVKDLGYIRMNQLLGRYKPKHPVVRTIDTSKSNPK